MPPWATYGGSVDYFDLFSPSAPWQTAASHVQVFAINGPDTFYLPDDDLRRMFADLDRRGIALAMSWGPLTVEDCGAGEGFNGDVAQQMASRLQQLGAKLRYIDMDEPFFHANIWAGATCHWTAEKVASNAYAALEPIRKAFPDVQVGDTEPFPTLELPSPWDSALSLPRLDGRLEGGHREAARLRSCRR